MHGFIIDTMLHENNNLPTDKGIDDSITETLEQLLRNNTTITRVDVKSEPIERH